MGLQRGARLAALLLAGAVATAELLQTNAQELQTGKTIRLIVGLSAGGGTDVTARLIAQQMTQSMGTPVVVENKAGGNFIPAAKEVLASSADGHTLYFISSSSLITQALHPDYPVASEVCRGRRGLDRPADPGGEERPRRQIGPRAD